MPTFFDIKKPEIELFEKYLECSLDYIYLITLANLFKRGIAMNSKANEKSKLDLHDVFIGFLFLTTASFFVSSFINAQMSDKSIFNSSPQHLEQQHLAVSKN